jgi:hypothetical protein
MTQGLRAFITAVLATKIANCLPSILIELGFPPSQPTLLYEGIKAAMVSLHLSRHCCMKVSRLPSKVSPFLSFFTEAGS